MDVIRFDFDTQTEIIAGYKIPDQYIPFYARYLVWDLPSFSNFFRFTKVGINRKARDDYGKTQALIKQVAASELEQKYVIDHTIINRSELEGIEL